MVSRLGETGKFRMKRILAEEEPVPDHSTVTATSLISRLAVGDFSSLGRYVTHLLAAFENVHTCKVYILPKKRNAGKTTKDLEHRLTIKRDGEFYIYNETSSEESDDISPENMGLRDQAFREKRPVIVDPDVGMRIIFDSLDINNRNCDPQFIDKEPEASMTAMMPFHYRDPSSPSGIVILEGDLRCRGTEIDGVWKTFYAANLAMTAADQISMILTHKFHAVTVLTQMADFEADLKTGIRMLIFERIRNLYLVSIDLDDFKRINDTYGHLEGNTVLRRVAEAIKDSVRSDDRALHPGGEEFAVILQDVTSRDEAMAIAERIRSKIASTKVLISTGEEVSVTCSIGVTKVNDIADDVMLKRGDMMYKDLVEAIFTRAFDSADAGLYTAKHLGKNRVCFHRGDQVGLQQ